ncbi:hypothetical protein ACFY4C_22840 [Actinomadura viridis]|uniref:hypothetical protein n=1 Tax=Actinomadura viridis TaxID=58110 RepID=UPI0036CDB69D
MRAGQAYWSADPNDGWGPWNSDKTPSELAPVLARAYPRAIAGTPTRLRYDEATATLTFSFRDKTAVTGSTEVWLPAEDFPRGATVTASDAPGSWRQTWDPESRSLSISTPRTGREHTITITPAR